MVRVDKANFRSPISHPISLATVSAADTKQDIRNTLTNVVSPVVDAKQMDNFEIFNHPSIFVNVIARLHEGYLMTKIAM